MTLADILEYESLGDKKYKEKKYIESLSECSDVYSAIRKTASTLPNEQRDLVESAAEKLEFIEKKNDYRTAALKVSEIRDLLEGIGCDDNKNYTHALAFLKNKADELCEDFGLNPINFPEEIYEDCGFVSEIIK